MVERSIELTQREGNRRALLDRFSQRRPRPVSTAFRELKLPTLIVWGGRDRLIPPDDADRFHRDIAGSTLVIFDDLGHAPEEEDPVRTVVAVKRLPADRVRRGRRSGTLSFPRPHASIPLASTAAIGASY